MGRPRIKTIDDSVTEKLDVRSEKLDKEVGDLKLEDETKDQTSNIEPQDPASSIQHPTSKPTKPGKARLAEARTKRAKPRSRKYQELTKDLDRTKSYPLTEAIDMVKKLSYSKFPATLEAHINTSATGIRGLVSLPYAKGRKLRILAFGKSADTLSSVILNGAKRSEESPTNVGLKQVERSFANAQDDTIRVSNDETIEQINKGKIDFDLVITTPDWMPKLAKVARILGPRGLMPNPKNGTITQDLKKTVEGFQAGKTEYKTEAKAPVIHLAMGKLDQPTEELSANIKTLLQTLGKSRVKKVTLSPTMGPSVKLDLSST